MPECATKSHDVDQAYSHISSLGENTLPHLICQMQSFTRKVFNLFIAVDVLLNVSSGGSGVPTPGRATSLGSKRIGGHPPPVRHLKQQCWPEGGAPTNHTPQAPLLMVEVKGSSPATREEEEASGWSNGRCRGTRSWIVAHDEGCGNGSREQGGEPNAGHGEGHETEPVQTILGPGPI